MRSLLWSAVLVVLASIPMMGMEGLPAQGLAAMAALTLLLWPLVAIMRWLVRMVYGALTGRRAP